MKRKDWISLFALLIIIGIALIGEQFHANGEWIDGAISLLTKLLPFIAFLVLSVVFRNRKGSYQKWWRGISYGLFAISFLFLLLLSRPFMHYFNVIGSQERITQAAELILKDCDAMFKAYEESVIHRKDAYSSQLNVAVKQQDMAFLQKEYGTANFNDPNFVDKAVDDWKEAMFSNFAINKDSLDNTKAPQFRNSLIENFDIFRAARELQQLMSQYDSYKSLLSNDFKNLNPFEKNEHYKEEFSFEHSEKEWRRAQQVFTQMNFNLFWFLFFIVLAFFVSSCYVFFKDDNVQVPRPRTGVQSIYDRGHKLI